ncbi:MAG: TlpA family protein disulfide reductase [Alphaproteobacteria bacterium]|nr:TlpA family protein disulfide reductase [Alphaproteobacteria bacterium]
MQRWMKDYAIVGAIAVAVVAWFATRPGTPAIEGDAPPISLTRTDGQAFDLASEAGHPVLLVFWAEWCGACKSQIDDLNQLQAERPDVTIIGLAVDSGNEARVKAQSQRFGIEFPVAVADDGIASAYEVTALPTNVFVGADGDVHDVVVGALDLGAFKRRLPES